MSFLRDKSIRKIYTAVIAVILLMCAADIFIINVMTHSAGAAIAEHDNAIISSLLEQGVSENAIAKAVMSTTVTEQAYNLMGKLGITRTDTKFLPFANSLAANTYFLEAIKTFIFAFLLLIFVTVFFKKRDNLYNNAIKIVSEYSDGIFSASLPQSEEGTLYRLFEGINNMAAVLKSKQETEKNTKEFLKTTVSDISHQLKTPLAALSMYNEIILDEPENTETVITFTRKANDAIKRIKTLILSLLKITRLDASGIDFDKKEYKTAEVINKATENLTVRTEKENKRIIVSGNTDETVFCDMDWTCEAIGNIIKNALDHTESGGEIKIKWDKSPMQTSVYISDNGRGIAPDDFHHIFKRFYRSKHSSDMQGIGLGLSLAKAITEGQGGVISVKSELNEGTEFTLSFPNKQ